jgi:hypothetical protein
MSTKRNEEPLPFVADILKGIYEPALKAVLERESVLLNRLDTQNPEEKKRRRAEFEAQVQEKLEWHDYRLAKASPLARKILELHAPDKWAGECEGCDGGPDYSGDWPCRTYKLVVEEEGL